MHDLTPITALGGNEPRVDTVAGVTLCENPDLALVSIAARLGHEAACRQHLADLLGSAAPGPGKAALRDPEAAFWMGPDHWMVCAPFDTHEDLAAQCVARFGQTASVTEQTDAWVAFDLQGAPLEAVMEILCNVNFRAMQEGDASRTSIHHLGCYVIRSAADGVRIIGPRASAGSLHHAILTGMRAVL